MVDSRWKCYRIPHTILISAALKNLLASFPYTTSIFLASAEWSLTQPTDRSAANVLWVLHSVVNLSNQKIWAGSCSYWWPLPSHTKSEGGSKLTDPTTDNVFTHLHLNEYRCSSITELISMAFLYEMAYDKIWKLYIHIQIYIIGSGILTLQRHSYMKWHFS